MHGRCFTNLGSAEFPRTEMETAGVSPQSSDTWTWTQLDPQFLSMMLIKALRPYLRKELLANCGMEGFRVEGVASILQMAYCRPKNHPGTNTL